MKELNTKEVEMVAGGGLFTAVGLLTANLGNFVQTLNTTPARTVAAVGSVVGGLLSNTP